MARGLKVSLKKFTLSFRVHDNMLMDKLFFVVLIGRGECLHTTPASSISYYGGYNQGAAERYRLPICWKSLSTGQVCRYELNKMTDSIFWFSAEFKSYPPLPN